MLDPSLEKYNVVLKLSLISIIGLGKLCKIPPPLPENRFFAIFALLRQKSLFFVRAPDGLRRKNW